jgi:hypothetical protein
MKRAGLWQRKIMGCRETQHPRAFSAAFSGDKFAGFAALGYQI